MKLQIILVFESGIPADDPIVTTSLEEAEERFNGLCEHYGLSPDDPHNGESDIWWWEVEAKI